MCQGYAKNKGSSYVSKGNAYKCVPDEVSDRALILGRFLSNKSFVKITI